MAEILQRAGQSMPEVAFRILEHVDERCTCQIPCARGQCANSGAVKYLLFKRLKLRLQGFLLLQIRREICEEPPDRDAERVLAILGNRLRETHRFGVQATVDEPVNDAGYPGWQARRDHPIKRRGMLDEPLF